MEEQKCGHCIKILDEENTGLVGKGYSLCNTCLKKYQQEVSVMLSKFKGIDLVEEGARLILQGLAEEYGLDLTDVNFRGTPKRVARAYAEIFSGIKDTKKQVKEVLNKSFPSDYNQLVIATDVSAFSMCPHHLLPVEYKIDIAYMPSPKGQVLGISKLSRIAVVLAKRPVLQEQFVDDVTNALMSLDGCQGAACIARGRHFCMAMRGAKQKDSITVTSSLKGIFLTDSSVKSEMIDLLKLNKS